MKKKPRKPLPAAQPAQADGLPDDGVKELSLQDALALAVRLQRDARLDAAITLYKRILQAAPDHPDALCLLGVAEHQAGRSEHALKQIRRAIELAPEFAGYQLNLGNVLSEMHRLQDALAAYGRALERMPDSADIHNNIGALHRASHRPEEARASFRRALALDGKHIRAWNNLGALLDAEGDLQGAVDAHLNALEASGKKASSVKLLGIALFKSGQADKAIEVFRQWMEREPDNPVAAHLHAAASGLDVPARAPDPYVEAEFDQFAASFESVLNERLHYRAPQLCADLLAQLLGAAQGNLDVLDAGCGTGLCGPLIAPWARHLEGVDLSGGMLAKARSKGVYNALVKAELTASLRDAPQRWDAIVCADTLCYFGDLTDYMQAAASSLRPGGTMVYTVEATDDDEQDQACFLHSGRYAHGRKHLDAVAAHAGLIGRHARREVLRTEGGAAVNGWLVAVQRPA